MRVLFLLLALGILPGCAMDDSYVWDGYEQEYYVPVDSGCYNATPMAQPAATPAYSPASPVQPAPVQPAGYQTREPPRM